MQWNFGFWSSCQLWFIIGITILESIDAVHEDSDGRWNGKTVCPRGWVEYGKSCYSFSSQRSLSWPDALNACNSTMPAHLVSVNSVEEGKFLTMWLAENDFRQKGWWTSGYNVNGRWEWAGDGSKVTLYPKGANLNKNGGSRIAYVWKEDAYVWMSVNANAVLSFICELPKSKIFSSYYENTPKNVAYGLTGVESVQFRYGPSITTEPNHVVTYSNGPRHSVALPCKADSHPAPSYQWVKASTGQQVIPSESNYVVIDGTLVVRNITGKDFGSYFCQASNHLATVRSRTASFSSSYVKEFPKWRLDVYGVEGAGKSIPCEAPPHFPQSLSFVWMYDTVKNFVHESDHVFVSSDGTLHFSHLTASDQKRYACSVVIPELHTGHYGPFFTLKVDPPAQASRSSSLSSKPVILDEYLQMYPMDAQLGSPAWIECFAYGRPAPKYSWTRRDGKLGPHAIVQNFGRRLYFTRLHMNDSGIYRCTAENGEGTTSREIRIVLQVSPKVVTPMEDVVVEEEGRSEFDCDVFSVPAADYEWFHNGKPLNTLLMPHEDQERVHIDGKRLTIEMVRERDAGVYQCFATNTVGQIGTSAKLVVRNIVPTFAKQPPDQIVYTFLGNSARLPCRAESLPIPISITWRHDSIVIVPQDGVNVLASGDLLIHNVDISHAGRYTCTVENRWGLVSAAVMLIFIPQLTVSIQQKSTESDEYAVFECQVQPSATNYVDIAVKWTFNDHNVDGLDQFRSLDHSQFSSIGSGISVRRDAFLSGELMCRADTVAGHASASVKVEPKRIPMTPILVVAHNVTLNGVHLTWVMPRRAMASSNTSDGTVYNVEACLQGSKIWKHVQTLRHSDGMASGGYMITSKLLPYSDYLFRVIAQNQNGHSDPSLPSNYIRTLPGPPAKAVTNLRVTVVISGEIVVQWKPLQRPEWGSDGIGYFIEWTFSNVTSSNFVKTSVTIRKLDIDHYVIRAPDTNFCSVYEVQVSAFNEYGKGPAVSKSTEPFIFTAPSSSPSNVSLKALNSSVVLVQWEKSIAVGEQPCQKFIGIKVFYWPLPDKRRRYLASKAFPSLKYSSRNQTEIVLTDLISNTKYYVQVAYFNAIGDGPRSSEVTVTTHRRGPRTAPSVVSVSDDVVGDQVVALVRWNEVMVKEERVKGYKLWLFKVPWTMPYIVKVEKKHSLDWQPLVELNHLNPFQEYKLRVSAFNEGGDGPLSEPVHFYLGAQSSATSVSIPNILSQLVYFVLLVLVCNHQRCQ